jgi:hypothetical protein
MATETPSESGAGLKKEHTVNLVRLTSTSGDQLDLLKSENLTMILGATGRALTMLRRLSSGLLLDSASRSLPHKEKGRMCAYVSQKRKCVFFVKRKYVYFISTARLDES